MQTSIDVKAAVALIDQEITSVGNLKTQLKVWALATAELGRANAHSKGGRSFWRDVVAPSIQWEADDQKASVGIADNEDGWIAAHKQLGGAIRPRYKKYLTIPISDLARGKVAADFSDYKLYKRGKVLGYNDSGKNFIKLFALSEGTKNQSPDPFMPTDDEAAEIAVRIVEGKL